MLIRLCRGGLNKVLYLDGIGPTERSNDEGDDHLFHGSIVIQVQASLQRSGPEMKLVVAEAWAQTDKPEPDWPLIKAVARSHRWMQQLISGEVASISQIAKAEKVTEYYISRTLRCASLAPDIVEAILQGRQPHDLNVQRIVKSLPLSWPDQRKTFGMEEQHQ
jgi:hypothetical protein